MRFDSMSVRVLLICAVIVLTGSGCGSKLKWRVVDALNAQSPGIGPLRIEATAVDTTELKKGHPFRWRGSKTAGFMLFDVALTNTSNRDLVCQVGHLDFPGAVSPKLTLAHFLEGAANAWPPSGEHQLVGTDDLKLTALSHEKATILTEDGRRYQILNYLDFSERYCYLLQKEMQRARGLAYIPYVGGLVSSIAAHKATQRRPKRLIDAQQMVMRPGVVPAGATIRGYLVFAWPPDTQPGALTLRLPVQPAHAASVQFTVARRD